MNKTQAIDYATRVKGMFPRMTDEQTAFVCEKLAESSVTEQIARDVLAVYPCEHAEFDTRSFHLSLNNARRRVMEKDASDSVREKREYDRMTEEIDAEYAALPTAIAEALRLEVLEEMPSDVRKFHEDHDPKKTRSLRMLIVEKHRGVTA